MKRQESSKRILLTVCLLIGMVGATLGHTVLKPPNHPQVVTSGRTVHADPDNLVFSWSGVNFRPNFTSTVVSARFSDGGQFNVVIDGER